MNRQAKRFIETYLDLEGAYDTKDGLYETLHSFNPDYIEAILQGFSEALKNHSVSVGEYESLTSIEFENEESLYEYLAVIYRHLCSGDVDQPVPSV
ncbi:hypothetical protein [Streptomyces pinistramenti]|uniref:hypothetical protein n=1 Tax=Streptomyces pinistramenti TaxID=2884812 RepID=UPI001D061BF7|nr:hypothetical protein [Streptomyces pinistramenti]MCB5907923.1 hypothetical protein [Streptomyces pinistramenti]